MPTHKALKIKRMEIHPPSQHPNTTLHFYVFPVLTFSMCAYQMKSDL